MKWTFKAEAQWLLWLFLLLPLLALLLAYGVPWLARP